MATRSAAAPAHGKRPWPLLSVLVDYPATLGRICELAAGTPITPGQVASLLSEADIERVVYAGPSRIVDLGRPTRFFSGALRRALELRDRRCTWPGCDTAAASCEGDHIVPDAHGGPTTADNGALKCPYHHRLRSRQPPYQVQRRPDGRLTHRRPDGTEIT